MDHMNPLYFNLLYSSLLFFFFHCYPHFRLFFLLAFVFTESFRFAIVSIASLSFDLYPLSLLISLHLDFPVRYHELENREGRLGMFTVSLVHVFYLLVAATWPYMSHKGERATLTTTLKITYIHANLVTYLPLSDSIRSPSNSLIRTTEHPARSTSSAEGELCRCRCVKVCPLSFMHNVGPLEDVLLPFWWSTALVRYNASL